MTDYVMLIQCTDEIGLIHRITGILVRSGCNIIRNGEFVDYENNSFFMRTEFSGNFKREKLINELLEVLPEGAVVRIPENRKKDIVILVSREYHCLGDLLYRNAYNEINARVRAVISNHIDLEKLVEKFEIPFYHIPHGKLTRIEHEERLQAVLEGFVPEYIVLAKYMRILSEDFVSSYRNRIVNIHHSFLPAFAGAGPYRQAFDRGVKTIGATAHFVNEKLDDGPIIAQGVITVDHTQSPEDMARSGKDVEKTVLSRALNLTLEDRVFVNGRKTVIFD